MMSDEGSTEQFTLCNSADREDSSVSPLSTNVLPSLLSSDVSVSPGNSLQSSNTMIEELSRVKNSLSNEVEELKVKLQKKETELDRERTSPAYSNELLRQEVEQERQGLHNELDRLSKEVAELEMKLQERNTVIDKMQTEKTTLDDTVLLLREQVDTYDRDFITERQAREQLVADNQTLHRQLNEKEKQFRRFNDEFTTDKFIQRKLATDNNELQQQVRQAMDECKQLKRQRDERISQLSDQITSELQFKKQVLAENQKLRDELQMKKSELYGLNNKYSFERQRHTSETDRLRERIYILEQTADVKHQGSLQPSGHFTSSALYGQTHNTNDYSPPPQRSYQSKEKLGSLHTAVTPPNQRHSLYSATPPRSSPVASHQYKEQPSTMPAYSPSYQQEFQCPLCARKDFTTLKQLEEHAAFCCP